MDPVNIATVLVAVVAALGAWASARAASRAQKYNADATVKTAKETAELEAYNRARQMDLQTIKRQDEEFDELRARHDILKARVAELEKDNETLHKENARMRRQLAALEEKKETSDE